MEITVAKKLGLVMIATVIMNSHFRCATAEADGGSVVLSKVDRRKQTEDIVYGKDGITICDTIAEQCGTTTYDAIEKAFPGAFETEKVAKIRYEGLEFNEPVDTLPRSCGISFTRPYCFLRSDGDKCCPTWRYFTFTTVLTNLFNQKCYIIQSIGLHQYIERGICGRGRCSKCEQQYSVRSLLAWCPGNFGLNWHYFKVPSYCSCQGTPVCYHMCTQPVKNITTTSIQQEYAHVLDN